MQIDCFQVGLSNLQRYYNIVYDQAVSPSGSHLAVCDTYGQISTFRYVGVHLDHTPYSGWG